MPVSRLDSSVGLQCSSLQCSIAAGYPGAGRPSSCIWCHHTKARSSTFFCSPQISTPRIAKNINHLERGVEVDHRVSITVGVLEKICVPPQPPAVLVPVLVLDHVRVEQQVATKRVALLADCVDHLVGRAGEVWIATGSPFVNQSLIAACSCLRAASSLPILMVLDCRTADF